MIREECQVLVFGFVCLFDFVLGLFVFFIFSINVHTSLIIWKKTLTLMSKL